MSIDDQSNPIPGPSVLAAMFKQSPVPIEFYNSEGKWEAGNRAALEIFGMAYEDTVGFDIYADEAIPPELREALKGGAPIRFQTDFDFSKVTYKTVRNDITRFEFYITPLRDKAGNTMGIIVQTIDLSQPKDCSSHISHSSRK